MHSFRTKRLFTSVCTYIHIYFSLWGVFVLIKQKKPLYGESCAHMSFVVLPVHACAVQSEHIATTEMLICISFQERYCAYMHEMHMHECICMNAYAWMLKIGSRMIACVHECARTHKAARNLNAHTQSCSMRTHKAAQCAHTKLLNAHTRFDTYPTWVCKNCFKRCFQFSRVTKFWSLSLTKLKRRTSGSFIWQWSCHHAWRARC
jgi:hypothetical protein